MIHEAQYICFHKIIPEIEFLLFKKKWLLLINGLRCPVVVVIKVWSLHQSINITGNLLE